MGQGPGVLKVLFRTLRGYRGGITPAAALDSVCNEGNTVLVDIRTEREKGNSGGSPPPAPWPRACWLLCGCIVLCDPGWGSCHFIVLLGLPAVLPCVAWVKRRGSVQHSS